MSRDLAKEVDQALSSDRYDISLFLRFLKSYVIEGTQPDKNLILGILLQVLPRFHTSEFSACVSLIQGHIQDAAYIEKDLGIIYDLENYLSCGRFVQFWKEWGASRGALPAAPSFEPQMRAAIVTVVGTTIERVSLTGMAAYLGIEPAQVNEAVRAAAKLSGDVEVIACDKESVAFARSMFNAPESDTNQQPLRFADIASIVS